MWRVEYTHDQGHRVFHNQEFHTRKAARLWCKKAQKKTMILYGPDGEVERFHYGE